MTARPLRRQVPTMPGSPRYAVDEDGWCLCPTCGQPFGSWNGGYAHVGAEENGTNCHLEGAVIPGGLADLAEV